MSIEENKTLVRRLLEAMNQQDGDALDEVATPDLAQNIKGFLPWLYQTFAGHHMEITDLIAEGNKVVARLATRGTLSGEWEGIQPTGQEWTNTGVYFLQVENGKVVDFDALFDELGHLKQLGATITPPA